MFKSFLKFLRSRKTDKVTDAATSQKFAQALGLHAKGALAEAQALYEQVLLVQPTHFDSLHMLGVISFQTKNPQRAVDLIDRAIAIKPYVPSAYSNRGLALQDLKQYETAIESYDRAIALKPDYAEAFYNRGLALQELKRHDAAIENYNHAIALKPDYVDALYNRGNALTSLQRLLEACESYGRAIALKPDYPFLHGLRMQAKITLCDWSDFENHSLQIATRIERGAAASPPFTVLAISDSPALQRKAAEAYVIHQYPANHSLPKIPKKNRHDKIRIGYFSADFRNHPVSTLTVELIELHDRTRFELIALAFGPATTDDMRKRLESAFDRFIDVQGLSDIEVAQLARALEIDIVVDLGGHTSDSRTGVLAMRCAPIQVSYLGYLGTMGADFIDYLIADLVIVPEEAKHHYSEKIVYLPSYQANDSKRRISEKRFSRQELGLPENGFVFCCFNNSYKITPSTFDSWIRILQEVQDSVLFLYSGNELTTYNLKKEASLRGLNANRLVFGSRLAAPEYLARYRCADLFLDTLPYNAGTTASDALWAGLPVLTCTGETFASRVAASLLNAIQLPELVTTSRDDYEALAIELARNPQKLTAIRKKLAKHRLTTPLFNTEDFTLNIESAYTEMYERHLANLAPKHIYVRAR